MMKLGALTILAAMVGTSCFTAVKVTDEDGKSQHGIRYYSKKGVHRQVTEYKSATLLATLTVSVYSATDTGDRRVPLSRQKLSKRLGLDDESALEGIRDAMASGNTTLSELLRTFQDIQSAGVSSRVLVENSVTVTTVTDYARPSFITITTPVFGSSTFKPELAPDGTLTKLDAVATSSPEKIADLIPTTDMLTKWLDLGAEDGESFVASVDLESKLSAEVVLDVAEIGVRETYTYDWPIDDSPLKNESASIAPLDTAGVAASYRRGSIGQVPEKASEGAAYTFTGSIVPPKQKEH